MSGLDSVLQKLSLNGIAGQLWVDGSFLTHKLDPDDVDTVLALSGEFYENGTDAQREAVDWLNTDLKPLYRCDCYFFMEWPEGHANFAIGQWMRAYWIKQYGFSRTDQMKGIACIDLPGGVA